jgi:hypothetical protein
MPAGHRLHAQRSQLVKSDPYDLAIANIRQVTGNPISG